MIGIIKYPKLASIILSTLTAYIQTPQLMNIKKPDIKSIDNFFLSNKIFLKTLHLENKKVVIIKKFQDFKL